MPGWLEQALGVFLVLLVLAGVPDRALCACRYRNRRHPHGPRDLGRLRATAGSSDNGAATCLDPQALGPFASKSRCSCRFTRGSRPWRSPLRPASAMSFWASQTSPWCRDRRCPGRRRTSSAAAHSSSS